MAKRVGGQYEQVSWFGLQMILDAYFRQPITDEMIDEAARVSELTLAQQPFLIAQFGKVRDLGYFPLKIKALPEGMTVPVGNALLRLDACVVSNNDCYQFNDYSATVNAII